MLRMLVLCAIAVHLCVAADDKYSGPRPAKPDVPYLLHANTLLETEVAQATESHQKKETIYSVPGASSPAKTPLAEPIFIMQSGKVSPETLQLFKFDVSNGTRQVVIGGKRHGDQPYHLQVRNLGEGLYRIEVGDSLDNGQYGLSPSGSNAAFCFEVVP
jgi:hypothetical protein